MVTESLWVTESLSIAVQSELQTRGYRVWYAVKLEFLEAEFPGLPDLISAALCGTPVAGLDTR